MLPVFSSNSLMSLYIDLEDIFEINMPSFTHAEPEANIIGESYRAPSLHHFLDVVALSVDDAFFYDEHYSRQYEISEAILALFPLRDTRYVEWRIEGEIDQEACLKEVDSGDRELYRYLFNNWESIIEWVDDVIFRNKKDEAEEMCKHKALRALTELRDIIELPVTLVDRDKEPVPDAQELLTGYVRVGYGTTVLHSFYAYGNIDGLVDKLAKGDLDLLSKLALSEERQEAIYNDRIDEELLDDLIDNIEKKDLIAIDDVDGGDFLTDNATELVERIARDLPAYKRHFACILDDIILNNSKCPAPKSDVNTGREALHDLSGLSSAPDLEWADKKITALSCDEFKQFALFIAREQNTRAIEVVVTYLALSPSIMDEDQGARYEYLIEQCEKTLSLQQVENLKDKALQVALKLNNEDFFTLAINSNRDYPTLYKYIPFILTENDDDRSVDLIEMLISLKTKSVQRLSQLPQRDFFIEGETDYLAIGVINAYHESMIIGAIPEPRRGEAIWDSLSEREQSNFISNLSKTQKLEYMLFALITPDPFEDGEPHSFFYMMRDKVVEADPKLARQLIMTLHRIDNDNAEQRGVCHVPHSEVERSDILPILCRAQEADATTRRVESIFLEPDIHLFTEEIERLLAQNKINQEHESTTTKEAEPPRAETQGMGQFVI